jgi:hypothetical protein
MTSDLFDSLLERTRSAVSRATHRRAWDAVRTAALLRHEGEYSRALQLLDDVVLRFEHADAVTAAYACATAIHSDLGKPGLGVTVGRPVWDETPSSELGLALARAYWEHSELTHDVGELEAWKQFKLELELAAAPA